MRSLDREAYDELPEFITVRETRIRVRQPGFRPRSIVVVTTLLDPQQTTKEDLATLYRAVAQRTRSAIPQVGDADAGAAVQDAGAGAQGGVDAHPGLQPHPHRDDLGRGPRGRHAAVH